MMFPAHQTVITAGGPPQERVRLGLVLPLAGGGETIRPLLPELEQKLAQGEAWLARRRDKGESLALELRFLSAQLVEYIKRVPQQGNVFLVRLRLQVDTLADRIEAEARS